MYKVDMLKALTTVALLTVASVLDAAPMMPGDPDAVDGDPRRTGVDEMNPARAKLLRTRPMTTFPDGDGKTVAMRALDEIITATSSPNARDKTLDTGLNNLLKTLTLLSDGHEEIQPRTDRTTSSPDSQRITEKNRLSEVTGSDKQSRSDPVTGDPDAREELVKMLSALEELHKLVNSTLSHRITIITRGNSNGRATGKKNKMVVTDGNLKSTTATTIDGGGISPKASTDHMDPKLNGKAFKKSLPSAKKTNKRVCFWKYCSQN
ncbi:urotensin II-related peptide [Rhinichthys klamathensis goyatoka]|uniref:urotensin II-related peptide n=1 Tax=Rhinichthys klamathensis goyatoka TaxID=3034132 RepID=UPI0024B572E2|nr:urotensin II-related peptide [Rhinichthys klamathensis goyatoka]